MVSLAVVVLCLPNSQLAAQLSHLRQKGHALGWQASPKSPWRGLDTLVSCLPKEFVVFLFWASPIWRRKFAVACRISRAIRHISNSLRFELSFRKISLQFLVKLWFKNLKSLWRMGAAPLYVLHLNLLASWITTVTSARDLVELHAVGLALSGKPASVEDVR